jgi:non-lysosomal glucosylceramidase
MTLLPRRPAILPILTALALTLTLATPTMGQSREASQATAVKQELVTGYRQLLMEKGLLDAEGREIASRLDDLLSACRSEGASLPAALKRAALARLDYSPANLGGFPDCAFDRPIGEKLKDYGLSKVATDLNASAEGNGCPVGGIGAGSVERTMSGNFRYWFWKSGWMVDETVWPDQFHVYVKKGKDRVAQTCSTDTPPSESGLSSWRWSYPTGRGTYYALYPKSGFSYEANPALPVRLAVTQFSPVIPHNYKETSYPVAVFKWIAVNPDDEPAEVSLMLTWANMVGWEPKQAHPQLNPADFDWDKRSEGDFSQVVAEPGFKAIVLSKKDQSLVAGGALTGTIALAAPEIPGRTHVTYMAEFNGRGDGSEVWTPFAADGILPDSRDSHPASPGDVPAAALAVKFKLGAHERLEVPFVLAWDFPFYEFEPGVKYRKKYTDYFGADGLQALAVAREALAHWREWEKAVDSFQGTLVSDRSLPDWLKQALFNELYILPETSIWDADTGRHTYLESADYLMYGTFDVDSYCWPVLKLWPELELGNMDYFARSVALEDPAYKAYDYATTFPDQLPADKKHYYWNTNKDAGMVPHDLGSPRGRPWVVLNAFTWQNGNVWKDLNPKFPLRAYRDFVETGGRDFEFLKRMLPASILALDTLEKKFADPVSHLPLNEGIPDQTYDTWRMKGESAYVGILWLASLKATIRMADLLAERGVTRLDGLDLRGAADKYRLWFDTGRLALDRLWNERGGYFNIDAFSTDIMTDQLFGAWYADLVGLGSFGPPVVAPERVRRALRTIYDKNVRGFGQGLLGAVNGRTAEGGQLFTDQGDEVWVGTSYAFASYCLLAGLGGPGLETAYGVYHSVYSPYGFGLFFKTPEAYCNPRELRWDDRERTYGRNVFRAQKYMRPGAVWAVLESLRPKGAHASE